MMAYTNGKIPDPFDHRRQLIEENALLTFKLKRMEELYQEAVRELKNIPEAIEQWGYVELTNECSDKKIRLIIQEEPHP